MLAWATNSRLFNRLWGHLIACYLTQICQMGFHRVRVKYLMSHKQKKSGCFKWENLELAAVRRRARLIAPGGTEETCKTNTPSLLYSLTSSFCLHFFYPFFLVIISSFNTKSMKSQFFLGINDFFFFHFLYLLVIWWFKQGKFLGVWGALDSTVLYDMLEMFSNKELRFR